MLARAAEPSWGHEHEHCEPRSPAPRRPAVRHRVAAHGPAPARPGQRGGRSRRGPGPLPRRGRDDHPARLRGPHYRRRRGYPAVPGRAAADPRRRQRPCPSPVRSSSPCGPGRGSRNRSRTRQARVPGGRRLAGVPAGPGGPGRRNQGQALRSGWSWRHRNHDRPGHASSCRVVLRVPLQGYAFRSHRTRPGARRASTEIAVRADDAAAPESSQ